MRRAAIVLGSLAVAAAAFLAAGVSSPAPETTRYRVLIDNAFGLVVGGDFRIGGVSVGSTTGFEVRAPRGAAPKAIVTAEVSRPGGATLRADASCAVKPQSLLGEYFLDCQPGNASAPLPDNTVPLGRTESTIPPDLVLDIMRRPVRERLRLVVEGLGTGLAGRADDLQATLRRAHPGLRETSRVLKVLGDDNRLIENIIRDADAYLGPVADARTQASRFVRSSAGLAETAAERREALGASMRELPGFLEELRPSMAQLESVSKEGAPLLDDLVSAAPALDELLTTVGPFATAARPALQALGDASTAGTRALRRGREEIDELLALSADAPGTAKPLRQFLASMDDRGRAIDEDPRAKVGGPPATDPSYGGGKGGWTGFEALVNYFFWQALSVNAFDKNGHLLVVSAVANKCSDFINDVANTQLLEDCNSWLGPNQPGINAPDPSSITPAERRRRAKRDAEQRIEPASTPAPAPTPAPELKPEPSTKPLTDLVTPALGDVDLPPEIDELLDFLLAP